jgi:hypothetical protein
MPSKMRGDLRGPTSLTYACLVACGQPDFETRHSTTPWVGTGIDGCNLWQSRPEAVEELLGLALARRKRRQRLTFFCSCRLPGWGNSISWSGVSWGRSTDEFKEAVDAVENARGLARPYFVDIRMSRSVREAGFRDAAFFHLKTRTRSWRAAG